MNRRDVSRNLRRAIEAGSCLLLACACAAAQSAQPGASAVRQDASASRIVPLVSDACPVVYPRDKVTLDWYPGFEHPGVVTGIRTFRLSFGRLLEDGVTVNTRFPLVLGGRSGGFRATNAWNGYFHFELSIPRTAPPGQYHLIAAEGVAATSEDYQGPAMEMTNSPVDTRLCITVARAGLGAQQQSNPNAQ